MSAALQLQSLLLESPAASIGNARDDMVLLHGWGCDSRIWQALLPILCRHYRVHLLDLPGFGNNADHLLWRDEALLLQAMADALPARAHIAGWSLGGNLALAYAKRYPSRVLSLKLIACNPSFVARADWPWGMPPLDFDNFFQLAQSSATAALRRFQQLQVQGGDNSRALVRELRSLVGADFAYSATALVDALWWLGQQDQRLLPSHVAMPVDCLLGESDALVPAAIAAQLPSVTVLPSAGHLPMLSQPQSLARWLVGACNDADRCNIDKQRIARSFSRAAASYDRVAKMQRDVGTSLAALLPPDGAGFGLDLGCGTGHFLSSAKAGDALEWLGGDIAEGMLHHAGSQRGIDSSRLIGMDADSLPMANGCLQGIYSNLALQWCSDLERLFEELRRVVMPGGWLAFSTLVEGTLEELKNAWRQVDSHVHVNHFFTDSAWRSAAEGAGWRVQHWQVESRMHGYGELRDLLNELKALGAHNVNSGMQTGLTGKSSWRHLRTAYESYRQADGRLPASWQVLYGVLYRD